MTRFTELMSGQTLLPLIQADDVEQGVNIAKAMAAAGLGLVEVVLRTDASLAAIKAIKKAVPSLKVGAGTVINKDVKDDLSGVNVGLVITILLNIAILGVNVFVICRRKGGSGNSGSSSNGSTSYSEL